MNRKKYVKKPLPCSFYDIEGIHSWLDEMALQGLFLHHLSDHSDRAYFERGEPKPVRYRLDPLGKHWNDVERKENYAQMGWAFVDAIPTHFYIFSCDDPDAPELYSDPETMGYALSRLLRRKTCGEALAALFLIVVVGLLLYVSREDIITNLILWEKPLLPLWAFGFLLYSIAAIFAAALSSRRAWTACRTLEQGLPLKAGRRKGWRPPYLAVYLFTYLLFQLLFFGGQHYTVVKDCDPSELSRPWRAAAEAALAVSPESPADRTVSVQRNPLTPPTAPVQERFHLDAAGSWGNAGLTLRYVQARSPALAGKLFQIERDRMYEELELWTKYPRSDWHISELTLFAPLERPGPDRLEVCRYRRFGREGFAFVLQRENEVLAVESTGFAGLEDCLDLFLEAL